MIALMEHLPELLAISFSGLIVLTLALGVVVRLALKPIAETILKIKAAGEGHRPNELLLERVIFVEEELESLREQQRRLIAASASPDSIRPVDPIQSRSVSRS